MAIRSSNMRMLVIKGAKKGDYLQLPGNEYRQAIKHLTGIEFKLFTYLHSVSNDSVFNTTQVGNMLGVSQKSISAAHVALQDKGYLKLERTKDRVLYFVGRERVRKANKGIIV